MNAWKSESEFELMTKLLRKKMRKKVETKSVTKSNKLRMEERTLAGFWKHNYSWSGLISNDDDDDDDDDRK